jgi:hypothetical protein
VEPSWTKKLGNKEGGLCPDISEIEVAFAYLRMSFAAVEVIVTTPAAALQGGNALDHKHITTTQIYDKRRRSVRDSASHKVPI